MNYEGTREKRGIRYLRLPSLWEVSIVILLFYAFFFQYGVTTINSAMLALNALCILIGVWKLLTGVCRGKHSFYHWLIAFVLVSVLLSIVFGVSSSASIDVGIRMIEYCLTGFSVLLFSLSHKDRYLKILFFTWLSILLLAIAVQINGTIVVYLGAVGIGDLNTNEMSSFFLLMVFCAFYLYGNTNNKFQKIIIWLSLALVFFIEIQSASRRGFIVMVFMIVMNIIISVVPFNNQNSSRKRLLIYSLIAIVGAIAFIELRDYILGSTILGERLTGSMVGGDAARTRYHQFALEQFRQHPIFGVGVGGINYLQGVYSHSLFYETLGCTGVVGALLLLISFFIPLKKLLKKLFDGSNKDGYEKNNVYLNKILLIYLVAILISGVAVVMIYDFYFYLSLALIAAGMLLVNESSKVKLQ